MKKNKNKIKHESIKKHYKAKDAAIYKAMQDVNFDDWIKPQKEKDYFINLCREIVGQQLSGKAASTIFERFLKLFDNKPQPLKIISTKEQALRKVGLSRAKIKYIKDLSIRVDQDQINLASLKNLEDEKVIELLTQVKGIGNWTAEMFLIFTLQREDVFSFGDLGLRKGINKLYKLKNPSNNKIERITSNWSPFKTYGSITLWHYLDTKET